ncbi:MAG: acyl-CoA synthetase [Syntrophomonadaceae bacterium]
MINKLYKIDLPNWENYFGPKESMPEKVYTLPELTKHPYKINFTEYTVGKWAKKNPDKVAIYFYDQKITYLEFYNQIKQLANGLRSMGVKQYDRVMIMGHNRPEWLVSFFAILEIGAIPVFSNHMVKSDELKFRFKDSEAVAILCHGSCLEEVEKAETDITKIVWCGNHEPGTICWEDLVDSNSTECEPADTCLDSLLRIIYSSGTTGNPKGGATTILDNICVTETHGGKILKLSENDIVGGHPFFSFAFGVACFVVFPWYFGCSVSISERFEPEQMFETVKKHGITVLFCVPTAFNIMLDSPNDHTDDLKNVRLYQSAGEPLMARTCKGWKEKYGRYILDSMGSGDNCYWLSAYEGMPENKIGSSGQTIPGIENIIVDENMNEVPRGVPGELIVRGPSGHQFWKRPDKQESGVYEGWSRPGIYATLDEDGYFWYHSRTDDIIVTAGYKIPCFEVEEAVNNVEGVIESACVPSPDSTRGTVIKAFVVLKDGYEPSEEMKLKIKEQVKSQLENYKYPRKIEFIAKEDMPRTMTDKILRSKLREREEAQAQASNL